MKRTKKCYKNGSAAILTSIVLTVAKASEVFRLLITDNCFPKLILQVCFTVWLITNNKPPDQNREALLSHVNLDN
jgi:hypothetical protein